MTRGIIDPAHFSAQKFRLPSVLALCLLLVCPLVWADETVWTGNSNTDWFNSGNWTNGVPDADTDVIVPEGSFFLVRIENQEANARDITLRDSLLRVRNGGRLMARNLTQEFLESDISVEDFLVDGEDSEVVIEENLVLGRAAGPKAGGTIDFNHISNGGRVQVNGTLSIAVGEGLSPDLIRVANLEVTDPGSELHVGTLVLGNAIADANQTFLLNGANLIIEEGLYLGEEVPADVSPADEFISLTIGMVKQNEPAPTIDLRYPERNIEGGSTNAEVRIRSGTEEFALANPDGQAISMTGTGNIRKSQPDTAVLPGNHTFEGNVFLEEGTLRIPGDLLNAGLVQSLGSTFQASGEIKQIEALDIARIGTPDTPGTLQVTEDFIHRASATLEMRIQSDGSHDALHAGNQVIFDGGVIEIQIADGDYPPDSEFVIVTAEGNFSGAPALVLENDSDRLVESLMLNDELSITLITQPRLELSQPALDFGQVATDSIASDHLTLTNSGQAPLIIQALPQPDAPFSRTGGDCPSGFAFVLAENESCRLDFTFQPLTPDDHAHDIEIQHNDPDQNTILTLQGTGVGDPVNEVFQDRFEGNQIP